jgi:hypothetical protein
MRRGSGDARIAEAAEDEKLVIRRWCTKEKMMGSKIATSATRANVKKKRFCRERISKKRGGI